MRICSETPLVLGSASPRRRELLASLDIAFVVCAPEVDEAQHPDEAADRYLERVVSAKLDGVFRTQELVQRAGVVAGVLVADTIVVARDGAILGKPKGDADARAMMARLRGTTHEVRTRFALASAAHAPSVPLFAQTVVTSVVFRPLFEDEVDRYVSSGEGRDKAGGYAIQGRAASFVESIRGSYTNVVGLPLCDVVVALRGLGWLP